MLNEIKVIVARGIRQQCPPVTIILDVLNPYGYRAVAFFAYAPTVDLSMIAANDMEIKNDHASR